MSKSSIPASLTRVLFNGDCDSSSALRYSDCTRPWRHAHETVPTLIKLAYFVRKWIKCDADQPMGCRTVASPSQTLIHLLHHNQFIVTRELIPGSRHFCQSRIFIIFNCSCYSLVRVLSQNTKEHHDMHFFTVPVWQHQHMNTKFHWKMFTFVWHILCLILCPWPP